MDGKICRLYDVLPRISNNDMVLYGREPILYKEYDMYILCSMHNTNTVLLGIKKAPNKEPFLLVTGKEALKT